MKRLSNTILALLVSLSVLAAGFAAGWMVRGRIIELGKTAQAKLLSTSFGQIRFEDLTKFVFQKNAYQLLTLYANAIGQEIADLKGIPLQDAQVFLTLLDCLPKDMEIDDIGKDAPIITMQVSCSDPRIVSDFVDRLMEQELFLSVTCYEDQRVLNTYQVRLVYNGQSS
ncbi:hypothetical protein [Candidatus Soleaferrea massiliensis]|uniref:hypothetical protein n=1 Tax=Candidatus Soleaferrea massiliensis TaxID=1470354 RepID=UPI000590400E|nr:hypothetical protein [Candidatus Soleaferrea massiliensis]